MERTVAMRAERTAVEHSGIDASLMDLFHADS